MKIERPSSNICLNEKENRQISKKFEVTSKIAKSILKSIETNRECPEFDLTIDWTKSF